MTKGPQAFRTISEASDELGVPQHVLRFWETKFTFIKPMKRAGGRRFYRPQDLLVLKGVRVLLHVDGYTIKGVQRLHREEGVRRLLSAGQGGAPDPDAIAETSLPEDVPPDSPPAIPNPFPETISGSRSEPAMDVGAQARLRDTLQALEAAKARLIRVLEGS